MTGLSDDELPGFWRSADAASLRGQALTLRVNVIRLGGSVAAAMGGAFSWSTGTVNVWAMVALAGFAAALIAEVILISQRPEQDWYSGRALAESAKTLAWRYAVGADPFFLSLGAEAARAELRARLAGIVEKVGSRIAIGADVPDVTDAMTTLRNASFTERKTAYIEGRTKDQHRWYARKAEDAKRKTLMWQAFLVVAEVVGLVLAGARAFDIWEMDISGIVAACIAAGAAWVGLKQYSALTTAYATAANELALQVGRLTDVTEAEWPQAVADAEEAISREHTMWLATHAANLL
ncbi:DUF4231 domain-containing protein [Nocardia sp. NPDC057030]|uniref:DUF4231 domain-containing protein n=1 Tax=unclassified Nocardia TaxID=2637762 RepID=UPI003635DA9D